MKAFVLIGTYSTGEIFLLQVYATRKAANARVRHENAVNGMPVSAFTVYQRKVQS